ncbi:hypothetical protein EAX61_08205 [Dokdonia sinensis]|uniref:Peptidase S74 domain-containing protein n=1 Tax=Dokdonia sinensis TaxID=2479847 RepID=A0A3M0G637_9FLAO|nr:tail fiber domain-containing protein [Dokdonia sinensis]RMB59557.1 hypothetical protein EAX61_08205 [Dokdonia sinensis]
MKQLLLIPTILVCSILTAQVGINTSEPKATLDISASDVVQSTDGILIPRITDFPATNPEAEQQSMLVYLTSDLTAREVVAGDAQDYVKGFYYWDDAAQTTGNWIALASEEFEGWKIGGNDDVTSGTHFLGTTIPQEVDFRVNNTFVARLTEKGQFELESPEKSVFIGFEAGESYDPDNTAAEQNTFIGFQAGKETISGRDNVAVGSMSLSKNTSGNFNSGIGDETLQNNTTGSQNTAFGNDALRGNTTGSGNTGAGTNAGDNNKTGNSNIYIGQDADTQTDGVDAAIAIGKSSRVNGDEAIAIGSGAQGTGEDAIAIGDNAQAQAVESIAIGNGAKSINGATRSIAIGWEAENNGSGNGVTTIGMESVISNGATNSIALGNDNTIAGGASNVVALGNSITIDNGRTNAVGIGFQASPTQSNQIRLGNTGITNIMGQVGITATSDARFKENIETDISGLEFITGLQPVSYTFNNEKLSAFLGEEQVAKNTGKREVGFLAQDVEKLAQDLNFDFSGIKTPEDDNDIYGLRYASFVVPLVKAVQEQQSQIEDLKREVQELKHLKDELAEIKALLKSTK